MKTDLACLAKIPLHVTKFLPCKRLCPGWLGFGVKHFPFAHAHANLFTKPLEFGVTSDDFPTTEQETNGSNMNTLQMKNVSKMKIQMAKSMN